jgi:hypothetical protein
MNEPLRWEGYSISLPGANLAALDRLIGTALERGVRIEPRPDGTSVAWRMGGGRYVLDHRGRCSCPAASAGRLCSHRALWAVLRAIANEPRAP